MGIQMKIASGYASGENGKCLYCLHPFHTDPYIYIYMYAHTHSCTKLWFSLVADMLTVKAKIPQKSHPVDCGDVAGCARGVTNLPIK